MNAKKRTLRGKPLLAATAGMSVVVMGFSGCGGNLVPPPNAEVCVTTNTTDAEIRVNEFLVGESGCISVDNYQGESTITVSAEGYESYSETVKTVDGNNAFHVDLTKIENS